MVFGILLLLLIGIAIAIGLGARGRQPAASPPSVLARRVYLYAIALSALGMLVTGLAGLLQVCLEAVAAVGAAAVTVGADDLRGRVSFSGALAAVGVIAWAVHWGLAERPVRRGDEAERRSGIRKLFLYLVLFVGGLILTLSGRSVLEDLLRLAFGRSTASGLTAGDVLEPLSLLLVSGAFWQYYAGVARTDRRIVPEVGDAATLRRWYVYGLSFFGLLLLLFSATDLLQTLWERLAEPTGAGTVGQTWLATAVAEQVSSVGSGLALWYLAWSHSSAWFASADEPDPESRSVLRKVYLYVVLLIAVAWAVWNLGQILYWLLRAALVPEGASTAADLGAALAPVLVFGLAWLYHARVVRHEAAVAGELSRQTTIRWTYGHLVALVGAVTLASGLTGTLATVLDLLVQPGAVRPSYWWEDRLSLFATLIVVGLPIWLLSWGRLQREAAEPTARQSPVRRIYLFLALGVSVLTLLGSGAFTLYQLIRLALGERWTAGQTSELLGAGSLAAVAGVFLAYHLRVSRRDAAQATDASVEIPAPAPAVALLRVRASSPELLEQFHRRTVSQAPAGVEVELLDLDGAAADRLAEQARSPAMEP